MEKPKQLADILEAKGIDPYDSQFKLEPWMIQQGYAGLESDPEGNDCYCFIEDDTIGACGEGCGSCYPILQEPQNDNA